MLRLGNPEFEGSWLGELSLVEKVTEAPLSETVRCTIRREI
jgi:hypothetical protein